MTVTLINKSVKPASTTGDITLGRHRMKAGALVTQGRDARVSPQELVDGFCGIMLHLRRG